MNFLANFTVQQREEIKADFVINAVSAGATWGSINGDINNQTDLMNILNAKADKAITINGHSLASDITLKVSDLQNDKNYQTLLQVNSLISVHNTSNTSHTDIRGLIDTINTTLSGYGNIVTHNVSEFATAAQGTLADTALQSTDVVNNLITTATDLPLSANMGKEMQDEIDNLKARGRFLALWNCATGLAASNPPESPYLYKAGDYFIIGTVGETNYRPTGSQYVTGVASTVVETEAVNIDDVYYYDGTVWRLQLNTRKEITFAQIAGQPTDNSNLASALNDKVTKNNAITGATKCKITYDAKGLVTAGADLQAADIPSLTLSKISDVTATATEVNVLDGITASTTELNYVDGVTSAIQTQIDSKEPKTNVTSKGTATLPVYFDSNAIAQTITSYEGNAATATKATQDGNGNVIVNTYVNNERLNALPCYENYTNVQTENKGLADLKKFNRSTFDLSKFTKVGTPTITADGIASGFSSGNYLKVGSVTGGTIFKYKIKYKHTQNVSHAGYILYKTKNDSTFGVALRSTGKFMGVYPTNTSNAVVVETNVAPVVGEEYVLEIETNFTSFYKLSINGSLAINETFTNTTYDFSSTNTIIGTNLVATSLYCEGSIDLKQFSITVDGVEVFNGNKTGVDTIKADDFTVEGTPTISADGIASGFSSGHVVSQNSINLTNASSFKYEIKFKTPSTLSGVTILFEQDNSMFLATSSSSIYFTIDGGSSSIWGSSKLQPSTEYKAIVKFANGTTEFYLGNELIGSRSTYTYSTVNRQVSLGSRLVSYLTFGGSIDLNSFKIYVDGNLVYQPLLRIPYNQSKTGSKIVQYAYRDRVQDMYNQFGWANYYTLSDTNFTLPMGENLDGHVTVIDWYKNGTTSWEYNTNLDCTQTGSCTSGTAVTFAKAFADTNYTLSVPYSAKSKTGFTPSQTGEYIAKGKITLG